MRGGKQPAGVELTSSTSTHPVNIPGTSMAGSRGEHASPPWTTRAWNAISSVNIFPQYVQVDDPRTARHGFMKTLIFVILFVLSSVSTILFLAVNPVTTKQSLLDPSLAEYQSIQAYQPSCMCRQVPMVGQVASIRMPPAANLSTNACGTLINVYNDANALFLYGNRSLIPNVEVAAVALSILQVLNQGCLVLREMQEVDLQGIADHPLGSTLLEPADLNSSIADTVSDMYQNFATVTKTVVTSLAFMDASRAAGFVDYSTNATERNPAGCSCAGLLTNMPLPSAVMEASRGCRFRIGFDWRANSSTSGQLPNETWTCSTAANAVLFPVELLDDPLYAQLGLQPPYDRYAYTSSPLAPIFQLVYWLPTVLSFNSSNVFVPNYNSLRAGIVNVNFPTYYSLCSPSTCTYTVTGRPSAINAFTSSLGVISGLQTILTLLVGQLYMRLVQGKDARANTVVTLEDVPSADGSATEQLLRVKPRRPRSGGVARPLPAGPRPASSVASGSVSAAGGATPLADASRGVINPLGTPPGIASRVEVRSV